MPRSVLVIGASGSIGNEICRYIGRNSYEVVIHYNQSANKAVSLKDRIESKGGYCRTLNFDINDREQCSDALANDIENNGVYFGVVLASGIIRDGAFPSLSKDDWDAVIQTNLISFYNVLQPIVMPMVRKKCPARIIAISSVSGVMGNRGQVNYSASKAGLIGATKALALELAKRNITVNCIAPGAIESPMIDQQDAERIKEFIPLKRLGQPREVASLVNYLLSDDAGYITRQVISVNGGMC